MAKKKIEENSEDEEGEEAEEKDVKINVEEDAKKLKAMRAKILADSGDEKSIQVKASKPISQIKKGDKIKIDGLVLEVDAHYVFQDYKTNKEMMIEAFDSKTDKDYQIRYFSDRVNESIEVFRLDEIIYNRINISKIEW